MKPTSYLVAACGPLRLFAGVRFCMLALGRARRRAGPGRGSNGWPFASLRVPCGARSSGPSHNSLRSLRSLRSNRCDESDHKRAGARGQEPCAARRRIGALPAARLRLCRCIGGLQSGSVNTCPLRTIARQCDSLELAQKRLGLRSGYDRIASRWWRLEVLAATLAVCELCGDEEHGLQREQIPDFSIAFHDQLSVNMLALDGTDVFGASTPGDRTRVESLNEQFEKWFVLKSHKSFRIVGWRCGPLECVVMPLSGRCSSTLHC